MKPLQPAKNTFNCASSARKLKSISFHFHLVRQKDFPYNAFESFILRKKGIWAAFGKEHEKHNFIDLIDTKSDEQIFSAVKTNFFFKFI